MTVPRNCCAVGRSMAGQGDTVSAESLSQVPPAPPPFTLSNIDGMVHLAGGSFLMGSDDRSFPADGESPIREVSVDPFWIDAYAVTNIEFAQFVATTNYVTEAERFKWSFVFYQFLSADHPPTQGVAAAPWWRQVFDARWNAPEGLGSSIVDRPNHPIVHISWNDANAYAAWVGKRLPTEAEWEYAARGGLSQKRYPWGDRLLPKGKHRCNIWQGKFPEHNTGADQFIGTCPVDTFAPNKFGLYNMAGNTWEWCSDWFTVRHNGCDNPTGPRRGTTKVMRGGSYLCHRSYCNRYRVAARTHNTPDSTTGHIGFRLVWDG